MKNNELETNEEKKKVKKLGQITFGITLILVGISVFVQSMVSFEVLRYILMMWPLIFISLGIEVIYYSKKSDINIKYDIWGVILIFIILICTTVFSVINYGVNKLLYNDGVKNIIVEEMVNNTNNYEFDNKLKIINVWNEKINVKIIEDINYDGTKVYINGILNSDYLDNADVIAFLSNNYSINNIVYVERSSGKNSKTVDSIYDFLTINTVPSWLETIDIHIVTNDKNNIEMNGNFNLVL